MTGVAHSLGGRAVDLVLRGRRVVRDRPLVMAIVSRTPDSFYDHGATAACGVSTARAAPHVRRAHHHRAGRRAPADRVPDADRRIRRRTAAGPASESTALLLAAVLAEDDTLLLRYLLRH